MILGLCGSRPGMHLKDYSLGYISFLLRVSGLISSNSILRLALGLAESWLARSIRPSRK